MVVAPPGSPTAKFAVGKVEYVTPQKDGAHVVCSWSDVDAEGQTRTDQIIWVLRKEIEGWRIAGMVMRVYADEPPLIYNFEDPEDMLRKQELMRQGPIRQSQTPSSHKDSPKPTGCIQIAQLSVDAESSDQLERS